MTPEENELVSRVMREYTEALSRQEDLAIVYVSAVQEGNVERAHSYRELMELNRQTLRALMAQIDSFVPRRDAQ